MSTARILVVEDEGIVARDIQRRLKALGYDAERWVTSAAKALAEVAQDPPDLILMDIQLKGDRDGIEAAESIQVEHDVPVVFLTAHADQATLNRVKRSEAFGYVLKPFQELELRAAVELALVKHKADRTLRQREQWLTTTLRSVGEAIVATDTNGHISLFNPSAGALTGWRAADAAGLPARDVIPIVDPDEEANEVHPVERALAGGVDLELGPNATLRTRRGDELPVGGVVAPIRDERGHISGGVCVLRDLTLQREHEDRVQQLLTSLRASNEELASEKGFLAALFAAMPVPVMVINADGRVQSMSARAPGFLAEGGSALPGDLLSCMHEIRNPGTCGEREQCRMCQVRGVFDDALAGDRVERRRTELVTESADEIHSTVMLATASPLDYNDQRLAIAIFEDVTELEGLRQLVKGSTGFAGMIGSHPRMVEIYETIREVANIPSSVLITGESGTGKELVARAIHSSSKCADRPFVVVNCAALPEGLLESELFGHIKGSFTGAIRDKKGRFELADGGTIFLDEIGELSPTVQVKLLRVLQERQFERVGGEKTIEVNVRIVSATNRDLDRAIAVGEFREDLFYRLCVVPIQIPPLRERIEDIPLLAEHSLQRAATLAGRDKPELTTEAVEVLTAHRWPGNVRELQNSLEFALIKSRGGRVEVSHLPPAVRSISVTSSVVRRRGETDRLDADRVAEAVRRANGNKSKAAKLLGVSRATLYRFFDTLEDG